MVFQKSGVYEEKIVCVQHQPMEKEFNRRTWVEFR